jgi:2,4-diketo-3-deoxy-L-fuconate hydrolase
LGKLESKMRFVRYGETGVEKAGLLAADGSLRALSPIVGDWSHKHLTDSWCAALKAIDIDRLPKVEGRPRLGPPLSDFRQILAIGLNYCDHAEEAGLELPQHPLLFHKAIGSIAGPDDDILLADGAQMLDWEVELAFVISKQGRHIKAADAASYIGGYCVAIDVSERDWQFNFAGQMGKGKSYDSFTPVGPWLLTPDELPDPQSLKIWLKVNGAFRQNGSTGEMVFSVAQIIEHVSRFQTLLPGDLIVTGTPAGVGFGMKPKSFLKPGDEVHCGIDRLGEQRHRVVLEASQTAAGL